MYMVVVRWQANTLSTHTTQLNKNGIAEAWAYASQLTHVLYLTTSDYLEVLGRHPDAGAVPIYTDPTQSSVTFTLL